MGWFKFKGKNSKDFGILISSAPKRVRPARRVEEIEIPGRSGTLTVDEETYDTYTISMECSTRNSDRLDEIVTWLNGAGELILSTEPDKVYEASIYNKISISDVIYLYNSFLLQFKVQPYKRSVNAFGDTIELTNMTDVQKISILNKGTVHSEPIITVYGTGTVILYINGNMMALKDIDGHITVNSEMMEVYKDDENANSQFVSVGNKFPRFEVGENTISKMGNVEKIIIEPNWRWL